MGMVFNGAFNKADYINCPSVHHFYPDNLSQGINF